MATGITVNGVDLDAIFDPYVKGTSPAATGYTLAGVDINTRYAPLVYGTAAAATLYGVAGADFNTLWAAYGTARYSLPFNGVTFNADSSGNISSNMLASITTSINADGSYSVVSFASGTQSAPATGTWLPSGQAASDYQVQFTVTTVTTDSSGDATFVNGAAAYSACTTNRQVQGSASVGQLTAMSQGGTYTVLVNLKRISTGVITSTTHTWQIQSVGSG